MEQTVDHMLQQGIAAHNAGNLREAERLYGAILQVQSKHPDANHNQGLIAAAMNQSDAALALFKTAVEANPDIEQFWLSYIEALIAERQFENAKKSLKKGKKKGVAKEKLKALAQKLASVKAESTPIQAPSQAEMQKLINHYRNRQYEDAETFALSVTEQFPKHQFAWKVLGAVLKQTGRISESVIASEKSVELGPQDAEAYNNLGNALRELGRLDEAEANLRHAIVLKPNFADAHSNLGVMLHELGRSEEAAASYTHAIVLEPNFSEAHEALGELLYDNEQYNLAAAQFRLSDTLRSRLLGIKCSYMEDEEIVFYEKFDLLVNQGEANAVIGSLALRSDLKYGVKKSNPFCNDPLKYVVNTDLNVQYEFEKIFIRAARDVLADNSVSYKAQGLLTNGVQTVGNIFAQGKVPETEIESIIRAEIEKYRVLFKDSEEGFIKSWPTSYEVKGWLVCMQSGGKLAPHMHDSGWITGSVYINVPPKSEVNSGNLVLCLSDQEHVLGVDKSQQRTIDVVTGSLCLFPSSLHHYTVPFEEKEDRIVLAFDVNPIG